MLINAYVAARRPAATAPASAGTSRTSRPATTPAGSRLDDVMPPEVETHLVNAVLTNGARYYVDHAHPEISTPSAADAREVGRVRPGRRGDHPTARWQAAQTVLPPGQEIVVYKNNSDGKGNSYGCHENYLMAREVPVRAHRRPGHAALRHPPDLHCGAGKVGSEAPGSRHDDVPFQLSQRADFFEEEVGLETTLKRPIVNTRDEPHCDARSTAACT